MPSGFRLIHSLRGGGTIITGVVGAVDLVMVVIVTEEEEEEGGTLGTTPHTRTAPIINEITMAMMEARTDTTTHGLVTARMEILHHPKCMVTHQGVEEVVVVVVVGMVPRRIDLSTIITKGIIEVITGVHPLQEGVAATMDVTKSLIEGLASYFRPKKILKLNFELFV